MDSHPSWRLRGATFHACASLGVNVVVLDRLTPLHTVLVWKHESNRRHVHRWQQQEGAANGQQRTQQLLLTIDTWNSNRLWAQGHLWLFLNYFQRGGFLIPWLSGVSETLTSVCEKGNTMLIETAETVNQLLSVNSSRLSEVRFACFFYTTMGAKTLSYLWCHRGLWHLINTRPHWKYGTFKRKSAGILLNQYSFSL